MRDFDVAFLRIADEMAQMSTCHRAKVGAALVVGRRIIATGYNGSPRGYRHCTDAAECTLDANGRCALTVHAEANALLQCAMNGVSTNYSTMYCTHRPCLACTKLLVNAGVVRIVFFKEYDAGAIADDILKTCGVSVQMLILPERDGKEEVESSRGKVYSQPDEPATIHAFHQGPHSDVILG